MLKSPQLYVHLVHQKKFPKKPKKSAIIREDPLKVVNPRKLDLRQK